MVNSAKYLLITCMLFLLMSPLFAQRNNPAAENFRCNSIGLYVGLIELNVNYERNIMQRPKSYSNIRAGAGYWTNLQLEGNYINAAFVHLLDLFGKSNSHLELNLGAKYIFAKEEKDNTLLPDIFAGYRYEKTEGRFYFRAGLSFPGLFSMGTGLKF